jgi:hypothetical protein
MFTRKRLGLSRISLRARGPVPRCVLQIILYAFAVLPSLAHSSDELSAFRSVIGQVSGERMMADVAALSGAAFNGRQSGTEDDLRSAQWVADRFHASQLSLAPVPSDRFNTPAGPGEASEPPTGFMSTPHKAVIIAPGPVFQIATPRAPLNQELGTEFLPVLDSSSSHVRAPIVFVGYGIVDQILGMNEYDGIDVHNCIVLFLRGRPDHYKGAITHADKMRIARQRGAVAYLTATGPVLSSYDMRRGVTGRPSAFYGLSTEADALPGAWISTSQAEYILAGTDPSQPRHLRTIQEQLNGSPTSRSFRTDYFGVLKWEARQEHGFLINVVATLPGTDPTMADEAVVIGAHRDHFGRQAGLLFPGADDNASGTAVILEVARTLAKLPVKPKRTLLFLSFSGEEQGLVGSRLYVGRPLVPLARTRAMINIDHAGTGNGRLTVGVTGLEKSLAQEAGQSAGLADKVDLFGFFPGGDHVPFKEAGIPTVTVVSGGVHPHFHQPTDTAETVNQEILVSVARYVLALTWQLANAP